MASTRPALAALATAALLSGCFAYNKPAKKWAYVGDTLMMLGGGGLIALEVAGSQETCMPGPSTLCPYEAPIPGALVAGAVLVTAGIVGLVLNATRPEVKTSR
jgi:hypothetical protein